MDTTRLLRLLEADDLASWPDLARDIERRADAPSAALALTLLHTQRHTIEAAQWLARVTDSPTLQNLRVELWTLFEGRPPDRLRALAQDLLCGDFRLIPAGSFLMGSPDVTRARMEAQHLVEITHPFLLKTTPVTQAQWRAVMGNNPAHFQGDDRRPVERVSRDDVVNFCRVLSRQTGGHYRLPTEAAWEYACRAGTTSARYGDLDAIAWYEENADRQTHPVAQKQPNAWGLYDMLGNVCEWCHDWHAKYPIGPQRDPLGPTNGTCRVIRGGEWGFEERYCRASHRLGYRPTNRNNGIGFRPTSLLHRPPHRPR
jgi:hypothetical protein